MATPRLSIIVKLPFAAPATARIASLTSTPMIEATSEALCITFVVVSMLSASPYPALPCRSAPILVANDRYSLLARPRDDAALSADRSSSPEKSLKTERAPPKLCSRSPAASIVSFISLPIPRVAIVFFRVPKAFCILSEASTPALPKSSKSFLALFISVLKFDAEAVSRTFNSSVVNFPPPYAAAPPCVAALFASLPPNSTQ